MQNVAFRFLWPERSDADDLDSYLYGSDGELRFNRFVEKTSTPSSRILSAIGARPEPRTLADTWQPALAVPSDMSRSYAVLIDGPDPKSLIADAALVQSNISLVVPGLLEQVRRFKIVSVQPSVLDGKVLFEHVMRPIDPTDRENAIYVKDWDDSAAVA
jgi:hypothetical protein